MDVSRTASNILISLFLWYMFFAYTIYSIPLYVIYLKFDIRYVVFMVCEKKKVMFMFCKNEKKLCLWFANMKTNLILHKK